MNLVDQVVQNFPGLTYCKEAVRGGADQQLNDADKKINIWMNWFHKSKDDFDWLRVKISANQHLLFRRIYGERFLVILNEHENKTLLLNYLCDELSESFEGKIIPLSRAKSSLEDVITKQAG